ncbi:MAG: hypothetical protein N5P05_000422 [Chroococcopsis gigantea SAG 12.99]|jgi:predicted ATP-grasp superfamily ATP-dependent carboligase|nr:hypothetical protein [Chroococcopsis gigantea SAG 12.99]
MMLSNFNNCFLQIGATRDGLDPYLDACYRRGIKSILIETPDYLQWRRKLKRRSFHMEIPVEQPNDPDRVLAALGDLKQDLKLVLPGFERYVECASSLAKILGISSRGGCDFHPPDKESQRDTLAQKFPSIRQPRYLSLPVKDLDRILSSNLSYPIVVKPANGGGGLGVFLVETPSELKAASTELQRLTNYDGTPFETLLVEEYIPGVEHSIQAFAHEGKAVILTLCEKFIINEPYALDRDLKGFRECGHIVIGGGNSLNPRIYGLAQSCLDAFGYYEGPFHIDLIQRGEDIYFVEMGFRLSGGNLVSLVRKATGIDWGDLSFAAHLETFPPLDFKAGSVGQIVALSPIQLKIGGSLLDQGYAVEIETFAPLERSDSLSLAPTTLAADILRHTGPSGRITVRGDDRTTVKRLLQTCLLTPSPV